MDRRAIVHLARVDSDHVAGRGLHRSDPAPRPLCPGRHYADAEPVMRVAREGMIGEERHRLDAREGGAVLRDHVHSANRQIRVPSGCMDPKPRDRVATPNVRVIRGSAR